MPADAANAAAASGMRMRYPASEATEEITPTSTSMKVSAQRGADRTRRRINEPSSPASSATPAPSIAMNTTATTLNSAKLLTNEEKMNRTPSTETRLLMPTSSSTITQSSG